MRDHDRGTGEQGNGMFELVGCSLRAAFLLRKRPSNVYLDSNISIACSYYSGEMEGLWQIIII